MDSSSPLACAKRNVLHESAQVMQHGVSLSEMQALPTILRSNRAVRQFKQVLKQCEPKYVPTPEDRRLGTIPLPAEHSQGKHVTARVCQEKRLQNFGVDLADEVVALDSLDTEMAVSRIESLLDEIDSARASLGLTRRILERKLGAAKAEACNARGSLRSVPKVSADLHTMADEKSVRCVEEIGSSNVSSSLPVRNSVEPWEEVVAQRSFQVRFDLSNNSVLEIPGRESAQYIAFQARLTAERARKGACARSSHVDSDTDEDVEFIED